MKKSLLSILILAFVVIFSGCTKKEQNLSALDKIIQRGKIIVGVKYDAKPFGYLNEKHELVGYDIDLARYIAKSILGDENKVEFKQVTPSSRIFALNSNQVDMVIATMSVTSQRKRIVDFSIPYYMTGQSILVPKDSKISSISDLNGKKVIIIFGSTAEKKLRLLAPEANIIGFKTYISGYNAFKQGMADAMTSDDALLMGFALGDNSVKLLPLRYSQEPYAVAFKKDHTTVSLKNTVNRILEDMHTTKELDKLKDKWIKY